jgi:UTP--glucose-1-phosphate uridylyltransferase
MGIRLLPSTKSQPKEMLPVGRKPVVQYVVEEFISARVNKILFITGRTKTAIENHFDLDPELQRHLARRHPDLAKTLDYLRHQVQFFYTRQSEQKGPGHAIWLAEQFVSDEPFAVALGDSIIVGEDQVSVIQRMMTCFRELRARCVIAFENVPRAQVNLYGIAKAKKDGDIFEVEDLIEKPEVDEAPSTWAVAARYIFDPVIFDALRRTQPGKGGEIQITDAIVTVLKEHGGVFGVKLRGKEKRYDIGNYESYFKSFLDFAIADKEHGRAIKAYMRQILR